MSLITPIVDFLRYSMGMPGEKLQIFHYRFLPILFEFITNYLFDSKHFFGW
jgi:hypothetical protein